MSGDQGGRPEDPARQDAPHARLRIMIVDDHPLWRDTLSNLLVHADAGTVVAEASDGDEAVERAMEARPDVVIMDINLPTVDGITATRRLLGGRPSTKVLVLASSDDRSQIVDAVRAGASGYLLKTAAPAEVVDAVRRIDRGDLVFPASVAGVVLSELRGPSQRAAARPEIRVVVAAPSILEREGIGTMLGQAGLRVVGSFAGLDELSASGSGFNVAVIDDALLPSGGAGAGRANQAPLPEAGVLVLTGTSAAARVLSVLSQRDSGIGYLLKDRLSHPDELVDAVTRVADGESVVDATVVRGLVDRPHRSAAIGDLSVRETEVLGLMAEGHSNQAIADLIYVGLKTVEAHVGSIFAKLGLEPTPDVHRRVMAVIAYLRST